MANRAKKHDDKLSNKTGRMRLKVRSKPYFSTIREGVTIGYVCKRPASGHWVVRREVDRRESANGIPYPVYEQVKLGEADDLAPANGETVLSWEQARVQAGANIPSASLTVGDAIKRYVRRVEAESGAEASDDAERRLNFHVVPTFGSRRITDLRLNELQKWCEDLVARDEDAVSKPTANRILANFKAALNLAFREHAAAIGTDREWRLLKGYTIKRKEHSRKDHFTEAQVARLIDKAREDNEHFGDLIEAGFHTGARYGELVRLDVRHFDPAERQLEIPDGKTGQRFTTLTSEAVAFFARVAVGKAPDDVLLPRPDGERWRKNHQQHRMHAALKAAKLPTAATFYSLRHTHISRSIERGLPLTLIAENVGTSVRMIETNYGKFIKETRAHLIESMGPRLRPLLTVVKDDKQSEAA